MSARPGPRRGTRRAGDVVHTSPTPFYSHLIEIAPRPTLRRRYMKQTPSSQTAVPQRKTSQENEREAGTDGAVAAPLTVAFGIDNAFALPLAATIHSLLDGLPATEHPHLYVLSRTITPANKRRLQRVVGDRASLHWPTLPPLPVEAGRLATKRHYLSLAAYHRILLADLLPPECSRVVYLDADVIVQGDVRELWEQDMGEHIVMAVRDAGVFNIASPTGIRNYEALGLPPQAPYFNSGVLLVNVDKWRKERVTQRFFAFAQTYGKDARFADQDGLNVVLNRRWGLLDERWNIQTFVVDGREIPGPRDRKDYILALRERQHELTEGSFIIHFTERRKPWHPWCTNPFRSLFRDHFRRAGCFKSTTGYAAWYASRYLAWLVETFTTRRTWKRIWEKAYARRPGGTTA